MLKNMYRQRTQTTINCELSTLRDFQTLCETERRSLSEKLNELMLKELDRNKSTEHYQH